MKINTLWTIVISGFVIRIILSLIGYHSDVQPFDLAGYVLSQGNPLGFYDYLPHLAQDNPILQVYPSNLFNYPPLVYFFLGSMSLIFTFFTDQALHYNFLFHVSSVLGDPRINLHLLMLKMPYFIFDGLSLWLIYRLFETKKQKMLALLLWTFNPINLYAIYLVGQFDGIPTFFVLLSLWIIQRKTTTRTKDLCLAALSLGVGAAFKIFPLFFLIPLALLSNRWRDRLLVGGIGVGVYFGPSLPFIFSKGFRSTALVANQTLKSLYPQLPISGGESVFLFAAVLLFVYWLYVYHSVQKNQLWQAFFLPMLLFFMFTHYHPQWLVWLTPFLLFDLVTNGLKHWLLVVSLLISFLGAVLFFDPGLSIGLFSAINPNLYDSVSIWTLMGLHPDYNFMRSLFQTLFFSIGLYYLYYYFPSKKINNL